MIEKIRESVEKFLNDKESVLINSGDFEGRDKEYAELLNSLMEEIKNIESLREKESKEAEKLQKRADAFLKYNPQGITVLAADKHRLDLNKEYQKIWRGSYDELMAKKLYDFNITITGGDDFYASYETKRNAVSDLEIKWPDGEISYLRLFQTPILDDDGEIDVNYYIYQDLTEQTEKMNDIRKLEEQSNAIVQENPMPILLWNKDMSVRKSNRAFIELTGFSEQEAENLTIGDFRYIKQEGKSIAQTIETKKASHGEAIIEFPAGTKVVERYNIPLLDENGIVDSVLTVYNDITLLREEIDNSKKLQKRAEAFLKDNPQAITVLASDKHRLDLNKEYEKAWRGSYEELMAKKLYDFDITVTGGDDFYASYNTKRKAVSDLEIKWSDGDISYLRLFQTPILDDKGDIDVNYYIYQDLTEQTKELKEIQKLQKRAETFLKDNPQAITMLAPDKHRLDLNKEYERAWHGSYNELMAKKLYDFDIEVTGDDFYASYETKKRAVSDLEIRWPDNTKSYLRLFQTPILDDEGEIDVNYYIYQDRTAEVSQSIYMDQEVANIAADLEAIAAGKPEDIKLNVGEADRYTKEIREQFVEISSSIKVVYDTLTDLINDIDTLAVAGQDGNLNERSDSTKYEGIYSGLVENLNSLMQGIATPIHEAMALSGHYAKGDFTARFSDDITVRGDFERFKHELNNVGENISESLGVANDVTKQIVINSGEISRGTDEVGKAAEEVAHTSQKAADLTRKLLENIEDINRQIADLSASNEEIASTSQEVFNAANHVVDIGREAQNLGNDANRKMGNVEKIANESVTDINELTEKIKEVSNVVKLINDITGQINLLALNAAIEAARAGEHGRGFAVVAGEVKNLAGEARAAADSIGSVVSMVQTSSEKTAKAITSANNEIVDGVESVTKTIGALNTIISNAGQVSTDIGEITRAIEDQANISNNVVRSADMGTEQTKEVQKEAEELAALAEEASASVEEIGSAIHEVSELANKLEAANSKFKC
ncbi:methyl-accepting chemotaxis protein [Methanoplanus endosymbiosus]|uniref:Methyl-accepting chemotaxis protein n=1 Tax=Methanoplanus endosymbiosus TaxID=33865 RepID=A0A9E7PN37_9EURY|nr:methyl-accepting chemotaxis protein [Methanoplanus endosymbiosus]UUX92342.1 methyl-accepting chemotaxis protein [Methanoplanus endosymbiosus]